MDYSLQADETIVTWEPLRKVLDPPDPAAGPGRVRIGPDWTTLAGNWFTKWERTVSASSLFGLTFSWAMLDLPRTIRIGSTGSRLEWSVLTFYG